MHRRDPHDVYIGRPSIWGNPFKLGVDGSRAEVIEKYRRWFRHQPELQRKAKVLLTGKRLACYCHPHPCHGDVLAAFVNGDLV